MIIMKETALKDQEFWGGARYITDRLTDEEFNIIEQGLEEFYPDGIDETELNDIFWFDEDLIASFLGYESFEELEEVWKAEGRISK